MRMPLLATVSIASLIAASPAHAQEYSNPGRSTAARDADLHRADSSLMNQNIQEFEQLNLPGRMKLAAQYRKQTEPFRSNAIEIARTARSGATLPSDAAERIRAALEADIAMWEQSFNVSKKERKAMRDAWLVEAGSLTGAQWAARRADWYGVRDAWIDKSLALPH